jgi:hypothetical protein
MAASVSIFSMSEKKCSSLPLILELTLPHCPRWLVVVTMVRAPALMADSHSLTGGGWTLPRLGLIINQVGFYSVLAVAWAFFLSWR